MPVDRRQLLQTLAATLATSHVRATEHTLDALSTTTLPETAVTYPPTFAARRFVQRVESKNGHISIGSKRYSERVPPGRFLYEADEFPTLKARDYLHSELHNYEPTAKGPVKEAAPADFPDTEESESQWTHWLTLKANSMAHLHVAFSALAKSSSEEAMKGLRNSSNSHEPALFYSIMNNLGGWPATGGDEERDALQKTLAHEKDMLFAFAEYKLPKDKALAVRQAYESESAGLTREMDAKFKEMTDHAQQWFLGSLRQALAKGYISVDLSLENNQVVICIDFSDKHPAEGLGFQVDDETGNSRHSTHSALNFAIKDLYEMNLIGKGTAKEVKTSVISFGNLPSIHTDQIKLTSSDPEMFKIARQISAQVAQQRLYGDIEKMLSRFSSFAVKRISEDGAGEAASDAGQMIDITPPKPVVYQISYKPPQGADTLLDFNRAWGDFSSRTEALATVLQRNGDSSISIDPRTRTVELTLDPKQDSTMIETLQSAAKRQVGE